MILFISNSGNKSQNCEIKRFFLWKKKYKLRDVNATTHNTTQHNNNVIARYRYINEKYKFRIAKYKRIILETNAIIVR